MKTLDENENFLAIEKKYSDYENSKIVISQVPYEHTVSYGEGTKNAPKAIIEASGFVEFYDEEFDSELCFEQGIATLPEIDLKDCFDEKMLQVVENFTDNLLKNDKFVVTIGGEHTISTAPIRSHFKKYPEMSILHFDAHSDLREEYLNSKYSHASFMARVCEFFPTNKITQIGIRALCKEEAIFIKENKINTFFASAIHKEMFGKNWQEKVVETLNDEIYVTFDVDFFDPAIMPTTGTPEPNGFFYNETLEIFRLIKKFNKKIIGFDIVELAPNSEIKHTDLTIARFIYKLLNIIFN